MENIMEAYTSILSIIASIATIVSVFCAIYCGKKAKFVKINTDKSKNIEQKTMIGDNSATIN